MAVVDPIQQAKAIDRFSALGNVAPGIVVLEGNSIAPRAWDERGGYGLTGSTLVFTGMKLGKFDVIHSFYDLRDWQEWDAYLKIVQPPPVNTRPRAIDVAHPWLAMNKVYKAVVLDNTLPKQTADGVWQIVYSWQAFRSPKFALAKPEGAAATPLDPVSAQIAANSVQIDALVQRLGLP